MGVALFIVSEALFFVAIFWAFFHSALSPTVELGAMWPPMGIEAINPFELPLLNTVDCVIILYNLAVLVKTQLYEINLTFNPLCCEFSLFFLPIVKSFHSGRISNEQENDENISKDSLNEEFYRWLTGFIDAEGYFGIFKLVNIKTKKIDGFSFNFTIGLHKDDLDALKIIKNKLGFGVLYTNNDSCSFVVRKKEDILKLISILDKYTLNTTKYLDFFDFKRAFILYNDRDKLSEVLINQILDIKSNMNNKRINFNMSKDLIVITRSWLLGFIEGDGSFSLERTTFEPIFSIKLTENQLPTLEKIKEFLENNLGFDSYSLCKLKDTKILTLRHEKARNNSKPLVSFMIKNVHILNNYLIPFLNEDGVNFITKKGKDFIDFKIICNAIYIGAHYIEDIKPLIIKLSYTMNNFRLSTYSKSVESISKNEIDLIINAKPTIEHLNDGRQRDINTRKVLHRRSSSCVYEIIKPTGEVLILPNLAETSKFLCTGFNTIKRYLDSSEDISNGYSVEFKYHKIKRIPVFYPKIK
jgi:hypothetical protein